jgi:Aromatic-ring-opening dioxygenase LigAB, LigA subunit
VSLYGIHKTLYLLQNDLAFRERLRSEPEAALAEMPLTDKERQALLTHDMAELYRMGAHTFLMSRLPRFNAFGGLTREQYQERLKVVVNEPARRTPEWMTIDSQQ